MKTANNNRWILLSLILGLSGAAAQLASGPGGVNFDAAAGYDAGSKNFRSKDGVLTLAIVTHTAGNGFFNPTYVGATAAAREFTQSGLPVKLLRLGSPSSSDDIPAELAILRQTLANPKLDGLAMSTPQVGAYKDIVNKAFELGIPVATFNSYDASLPRRKQISHTGQNSSAATIAGDELVNDLILRKVTRGKIIMLNFTTAGNVEVDNRVKAAAGTARASLRVANLTGIVVDDGQGVGVDVRGSLKDATNDIVTLIKTTPDVVGFFAPNGAITPALGAAVRQLGQQGKLSTYGFDLGPAQLDYIRDGSLTGSLGQQPFLQGYWPIKQLVLQIDRGVSAANLDTRAEVVTRSNLARFRTLVKTRFTN